MRGRRDAARDRGEHERLADDLAHRLRLQPLEHRRQRQRQREHRHDHVVQEIAEPRPGTGVGRDTCRRSAASRFAPRGTRGRATSAAAASTGAAPRRRAPACGSTPRLAPVTMPSGRPTSVASDQRGEREDRGVGRAFGDQVRHRAVVDQRAAEVEPDRLRQPVDVLSADRSVQAIARAQRLGRFAIPGLHERRSAKSPGASRVRTRATERPRRRAGRQRRTGARGRRPSVAHGNRVGRPQQLRTPQHRLEVRHARRCRHEDPRRREVHHRHVLGEDPLHLVKERPALGLIERCRLLRQQLIDLALPVRGRRLLAQVPDMAAAAATRSRG